MGMTAELFPRSGLVQQVSIQKLDIIQPESFFQFFLPVTRLILTGYHSRTGDNRKPDNITSSVFDVHPNRSTIFVLFLSEKEPPVVKIFPLSVDSR